MKIKKLTALCLILLVAPFTSDAAINLDRTRLVFSENDKASSLRIDNQSKGLPYLALSWIEDENGKKEDTHFMALPPIQRVEPGTSSQVRIVKQPTTARLPKDRESLFYFNLREVPPKSTRASSENSVMQVAMQSRIKLFWRPKAITKKAGDRSEMKLEVSATSSGLSLHNPTPYYLTIAWISQDSKTMLPDFDSVMIAPLTTATVNLSYHGNFYSIGYIDDYGALKKMDAHCGGTARCRLTEHEVTKNAKAH